MPIPGLTDMYQFVDWLKEKKYHLQDGSQIIITGEKGGLIYIAVRNERSEPCNGCGWCQDCLRKERNEAK